jgi:hypothetical protein
MFVMQFKLYMHCKNIAKICIIEAYRRMHLR